MLLSIENPPPDPNHVSSQLSHLDSASHDLTPTPNPASPSSSSTSSPSKLLLPSPEAVEPDLPNPPPLDHQNTLPSFSIRDYVFSARSKNIKTNWPFSSKSLQLCSKHVVKDVLPPFQSLDVVRKQSLDRCTVVPTVVEKQKTHKFAVNKLGKFTENGGVIESADDVPSSTVNLVENRVDISSCGFGGDDFPSTTTSVSQSDIDSVPKHVRSNLILETQTSVKASTGALGGGGGPSVTHKTENTSRQQGKKCRLIVKFGGNSGRSSVEDIASTSTHPISESMASKVCPVCKTFSSSSNTTLNAHIDQCLAVETTPKWTADSKTTKSKVKPRRIRLMLDIYKTAPTCTLEELDRRNGRTWATDSSLPTEETDRHKASKDGKRERVVTQVLVEKNVDSGDVGPVYIDANGTKVRILSKSTDIAPVAKEDETRGGKKLLKGNTGSKYMAMKKRKNKHKKYLKLAAQSKKFFAHKTRGSQLHGNHERGNIPEKELHASRQITPGSSGNLRPWVCSKPRGSPKKTNNQEGQQPVRWPLPHSLLGESDQSMLGDSSEESTGIQKFTNLSENLTSPRSHEKQCSPPVKRKRGRPSLRPVVSDDVGKSFNSMKQNVGQLNRDDMIRCDRSLKPPTASKNQMESLDKQTIGSPKTATDRKSGQPRYSSSPGTLSKAMRFSSYQKRELSLTDRPSSIVEARSSKFVKKGSNLEEPQVHVIDERQDKLAADQRYNLMRGNQLESDAISEESPRDGNDIMDDPRRIKGMLCNSMEEDGFNSSRELVLGEENVHESLSKAKDGRHGACLSNSMDTAFYTMNDASDPQSATFRSVEDYRGLLSGSESPTDSAGPDFVNDHEMFSADDISNGMMGQRTEIGAELDSEAANGNSFPEIDPIPIPGPPGSFLPSPRDMGSEDYHGNSSVTTSRAQSSLDLGNVVDRDSSNSPTAASSISNSTAHGCGFDSASSAILPPNGVESSRSVAISAASVEPFVQNGNGGVPSAITEVGKPSFDEEQHITRIEKGSLAVRNDQPCCCQRKERLGPDFVLNQQDSLLLRRRMASMKDPPSDIIPKDHRSYPMSSTVASSPSNCPTSGTENTGFPVVKPRVVVPLYDPPSAGVRVLAGMYCESSSSPSTPNPVLRLMGKNLMVVNKDEDASKPLFHLPSHHLNNNSQSPQFPTFTTASPGNVQNLEPRAFQNMVPLHFGGNPYTVSPYFNDSNFSQPQFQLPKGSMFRSRSGDEGFTTPMEPPREFKDPSSHCAKEIIVIDDSPENEILVTNNVVNYIEGGRHKNDHVIPSGIFLQGVPSYHQSQLHIPSACYPPLQDRSNLHSVPSSRLPNVSNNVRMLNQSLLPAASSASTSVVHSSSSSLYYPPSFS
ncbi:hypothetical protein LINPERPRIM_LOCUS43316 [Linum perenne]